MDDNGKFSKKLLTDRLRELGRRDAENAEEWEILNKYRELLQREARLKAELKIALDQLEMKIIGQYPRLSLEEIKSLVVDKKWMAAIENRIKAEMDAISYRLTERIKELAERYETPLPQLAGEVENLTEKVEKHLKDMGYVW
jgi:type I restriction enzyme M protein